MNPLFNYTPLLIKGFLVTVCAWMIAASVSLILGFFLGIYGCNQLSSTKRRVFIRFYTFVAKGIPAYVQILIAYFVIPELIGINIPGFIAAVGALAFCSSGYVIEIVRASINAIPRGQWEASAVLGYSIQDSLKRIIIPQAITIAMPSLIGELEQLLKSTALLATIGVTELTRSGMNIISRELNPLPVYLLIALIYLILSAILPWIISQILKCIRIAQQGRL